jgi:hypothetical protein
MDMSHDCIYFFTVIMYKVSVSDHDLACHNSCPDFEGRCGEVGTSPEIVLHLP